MAEDELISVKRDILINIARLHQFSTGTPVERGFHRSRIKNGKNFVATESAEGWVFSPSKFAGYSNNGLHHADRLRQRDGRVTDVQITRLIGRPLEIDDSGYSEVDAQFESYCSAHRITPSRHPRARRYWIL